MLTMSVLMHEGAVFDYRTATAYILHALANELAGKLCYLLLLKRQSCMQ